MIKYQVVPISKQDQKHLVRGGLFFWKHGLIYDVLPNVKKI